MTLNHFDTGTLLTIASSAPGLATLGRSSNNCYSIWSKWSIINFFLLHQGGSWHSPQNMQGEELSRGKPFTEMSKSYKKKFSSSTLFSSSATAKGFGNSLLLQRGAEHTTQVEFGHVSTIGNYQLVSSLYLYIVKYTQSCGWYLQDCAQRDQQVSRPSGRRGKQTKARNCSSCFDKI